ncbi:MAG: hypothetical protein LBU65_08670 [Planctomycetaceae bacterium]|nr:hypothetical protein [Planctomycetaceae bacterium]
MSVKKLFLTVIVLTSFFTPTLAQEPIRHRLLLLDESRSQLLYVDQIEPEKNWTIKVEGGPAWGLQLIDNNRVLIAIPKLGGYREYDITTHETKREFFDQKRYGGTLSAIRLQDGQTVLGCDRNHVRIFVLNKDNKETASWEFPDKKTIRQVRLTPRNTLLFGANNEWIYELTLEGKIVRECKISGSKHNYQVIELENGNLLSAAGYGGFLAEIDKENKEVRRIGQPAQDGVLLYFMSQFQVLKNGNIVVATWTGHGANDSEKGQQVVEFDKTGKVIWKWHEPKQAGSIHSVIVLDE